MAVTRQNESLALQQWQEGDSLETLGQDKVVMTTPDISMREALEIRYRTGQPVLLGTERRLEGVLSDNDFYHALLGKHFSAKLA